jgi:hypothetical protein
MLGIGKSVKSTLWQVIAIGIVVFLSGCNGVGTHDSGLLYSTDLATLDVVNPDPIPDRTSTTTVVSNERPAVTPLATQPVITATPNPYYTATSTIANMIPEVNPLTGEFGADSSLLSRRPIMVKISNYPRDIRPQAGWSMADIVFEYYLGEGMNRFLAIFYGQNPPWAGPIRSGRLVDAQLGLMYKGILVYGGSDERVDSILTSPLVFGEWAIDTRYHEVCPPICGKDTHSLEGVFVDPAALGDYLKQSGLDPSLDPGQLVGASFEAVINEKHETAEELTLWFSNVCQSQWRYDPDSGNYLRWEESDDFSDDFVPSTDAAAGMQQIGFENIVVLFSKYVVYDVMLHDIAILYEDELMPAMMFRDGVISEGYWFADANGPLKVFDPDGSPYHFKPGATWFVLVTEDSSISNPAESSWRITFQDP